MKIAIYGKPYENSLNQRVNDLISTILAAGFDYAVYDKYAVYLAEQGFMPTTSERFSKEDVAIEEFSCLVSIGGDGTLLETATLIRDSGVPVIGINAGRLGFISSVTMEEFEGVLETIKDNSFVCDERTLLQVETERGLFGDSNFGLNELTIHKKDTAAMVKVETYLDGEFLNNYWADGLIVATPTGSTAYSLSCGGPIIVPGSENVVLTPIAPHNLNVRPVVLSNNHRLSFKVRGRSDSYLIALDSRTEILEPNEEVIVSRAPFSFRLIRPAGSSFLNTMRKKLAWGLDKRN